uniref:Uncharacterized protein n=1 Tax=Lupinus angustifolius TaxID=3871 RepID=A0A182BFA8_LUPAN|nr:hypothetical protein [Lupinus angustifolius]
MVCLGALFGCKRSTTIVGYLLSVLVTVSILCVLRLICYGIHWLLKKKDSTHDVEYHPNDGIEMQSQNTRHGGQ